MCADLLGCYPVFWGTNATFWFHAALFVCVGTAGAWGKVLGGQRKAGFWLEVLLSVGQVRFEQLSFLLVPHRSPLSSLQAPRDVWYEAEKVWLIQQDGFTLGNLPSCTLTSQH